MYILEKHGGRLPLKIKAIPEGTTVPYKNGKFTTHVQCHVFIDGIDNFVEACTCG